MPASVSSLAGSLWLGGGKTGEWQGIGGNFADKGIGIIAFGTLAGGLGTELAGGNFWQGAATGLVVSGLNHWVHSKQQKILLSKAENEITKYLGYELNCTPEFSLEQVYEMIKNSPELTRLYQLSEGRSVFKLNPYNKSAQTNGNTINLFINNFRDIVTLFLNIGHELNQVYDNLYLRTDWKLETSTSKNFHSEARAWYWDYKWFPSNFSLKNYNYYNNFSPLTNYEKSKL